MKVGIDLDGVVYDFENALRDWFVLRYGWNRARLPDATRWEIADEWGISREQFVWECTEATRARFLFVHGEPINDSVHQLGRLRKAGHEIHFITARDFGPNTKTNTYAWLDLWRLPYDSLTFSSNKTAVRVDAMIDDYPGNVTDLISVGVDAYLQDRLYNRDFDCPTRVSRLKDFVDTLLCKNRLVSL